MCVEKPPRASSQSSHTALIRAVQVQQLHSGLVRRAVIDTPYLLEDGTELPISASIGACPLPVGMPLETALEQADTALYAAKHGGRNRVALAGDPIPGAIRHSG